MVMRITWIGVVAIFSSMTAVAIRELLPPDTIVAGFDNISAALDVSSVHLLRYQDEAKLQQLAAIEEAELKLFADFLGKMKRTGDGGASLLAQTIVLHASHLGNASSHAGDNLPILLAGGGSRHAGHVAYDRKNKTPLTNLFVRMLHQMEIPVEKFGASTGVVSELG